MSFDNAYESLLCHEDAHWAFGTGFSEALSGVNREFPPGVDREALAAYCLMLGDDALILSQRLSEWCSRAPELEEDIALANIALDLLGQARMLLTRAGEVLGRDEDELAYLRDEREFRNVHLAEIDCGPGPGGDFGTTIARLLVFSSWRLAVISEGVYARYLHGAMGDQVTDDVLTTFKTGTEQLAESALAAVRRLR